MPTGLNLDPMIVTSMLTFFVATSVFVISHLIYDGIKQKKNKENGREAELKIGRIHSEINDLKGGQAKIHLRIDELAKSTSKTAGAVETIVTFITSKNTEG